jgi:8-oxo-dGTP pyrophosphatase MutT (NUDIX family)
MNGTAEPTALISDEEVMLLLQHATGKALKWARAEAARRPALKHIPIAGSADVVQSPAGFTADDQRKDFSLGSPLASGLSTFDLAGPAGQRAANNVGERRRRFRTSTGRRRPFAEVVASFATPLQAADAFAKGVWDTSEYEVHGTEVVTKRAGAWHNSDGLSPTASEEQLQEHILTDHAPRVHYSDVPAGGRDTMDRFHASLHAQHGAVGGHRVPTWADKATNGSEAWEQAQAHPDVTGTGYTDPVLAHPASLATADVVAAGLAVRADDTGRVLMLQRALSEGPDVASGKTDPAAGKWEFPGGKLEPREMPWEAAVREWQEETGFTLPIGRVVNNWRSPNGVYEGFVYVIGSEAMLPINDPAHQAVINPDDPDGDITETLAWWNPDDIPNNPGVRAEVLDGTDWRALRTPTMLTAKLGKEEVHYRPATGPTMRCGTCSMFLPEGACTLVDGTIDAAAVCDQWDPKQP